MKNKNIIIIIIILTLLVLGLTGYIVYDKVLLKENNNNVYNNNAQDTTGKIYVKRDGVINLEEAPADIVGRYVRSSNEDDYFILKSDGTAIVGFVSDDNGMVVTNDKMTYQLTYNGNFIVLELYTKEGPTPISPIFVGSTHISGGGFSTVIMTPSANPGEVYTKID